MSNNKHRAELLKLMKEHKMYTLPTSCRCGYKAKDGNWIDMEKHYESCGQYRNSVKIYAKELAQKKSVEKPFGFEAVDKIEAMVKEIRKAELENKGEGYKYLESIKNKMPEKIRQPLYEAIKYCLDNPDKSFTCNVEYIVKK
jgi:hypothetical protein